MDETESVESYSCEKCGKEFAQKRYLTQHINRKTPCNSKIKREYKCHKCGKSFDHRGNYVRHLEDRKTPCEPIVNDEPPIVLAGEDKCPFCGRVYKNAKRLEEHLQKCKIANNKKVYNGGTIQPGQEVLLEKIERLESLVEKLVTHQINSQQVTNHVTNHIHIENMQQNNIVVNNFFGEQDFKGIAPTDVVKMLKLDLSDIIPKLTSMIHGTPDLKSNHNIFLPKPSSDKVMVLDKNRDKQEWKLETLQKIIPILMKRGVDLMYKADDDLTEMGNLLSDEDGDKFEMLINKQRSNTIDDEDIEKIKEVLHRMTALCVKK